MLSALDSVTAQIGQDDKQTYKDAIRQRWATFDLKRALSEMLARLAGGQQSPATT